MIQRSRNKLNDLIKNFNHMYIGMRLIRLQNVKRLNGNYLIDNEISFSIVEMTNEHTIVSINNNIFDIPLPKYCKHYHIYLIEIIKVIYLFNQNKRNIEIKDKNFCLDRLLRCTYIVEANNEDEVHKIHDIVKDYKRKGSNLIHHYMSSSIIRNDNVRVVSIFICFNKLGDTV